MLENFIYSVNVTFPIFLVMVIGWFLRQRGMFNDNFINIANKFNFTVTLPFMVFRDISAVDLSLIHIYALKYFQMGLKNKDAVNKQELMKNEIAAYEYSGDFESAKKTMQAYIKEYKSDEEAVREYTFLKTR